MIPEASDPITVDDLKYHIDVVHRLMNYQQTRIYALNAALIAMQTRAENAETKLAFADKPFGM